MPDQIRKRGAEPDTTALSLEEFVRSHSAGRPCGDSASEGPTMFFVRAATETCRQSNQPVVNPKDTGPLPPASVLGIVSYCYAKGVYAAEDIERRLLKDSKVREACGNEVPRASAIRRFRRLNREAIFSILERFFRRIRRRATPHVPGAANPAAEAPGSSNSAAREIDNTQTLAKKEALHRLDKAAFIDGMSAQDI